MESKLQSNKNKITAPMCTKPCCFFCTLNEQDPSLRKSKIIKALRDLPLRNHQEHVLELNCLWKIAMTKPNDPEFPSLGVFECMARLIHKSVNDKEWLLSHQNIYIPYYAAHIIGSYTLNKPQFAHKAVRSGVVLPLIELMRGKITWVEQRVAVRALAHIASHDKIFEEAIGLNEVEIVESAMEIALTCVREVFDEFVGLEHSKRLKYQSNLVTRGLGGLELENKKAEEWVCQLQCWSLNLLNSFASKEKSLTSICKKEFLIELCGMWGCLANQTTPAGIRLLRSLCQTRIGRESVGNLPQVIEALCNLSRSSDDWQIMAIDCLLLLLKDMEIRHKVMEISAVFLVDLVELKGIGGRAKIGDTITQLLLQDYHKVKYGTLRFESRKVERALEEIWDLKVDRKKREKLMSEEEINERKLKASRLKKEGNMKFWLGKIEEAAMEYSEALDLCPLKIRKERLVLYSNRAQCYLLMKKAEAVISDTTRALCLSSSSSAVSPHGKSLWRRSQAYDMKGLARESLMDCLWFVNGRIKSGETERDRIIPRYAGRMINKQMKRTCLFAHAKPRTLDKHDELHGHSRPTIAGETFGEKRLRRLERESRRKIDVNVSTNRLGRLNIV